MGSDQGPDAASSGFGTDLRVPFAFAERWAEFTKASAIYPPRNVRVTEALDAALAALGPALEAPVASRAGRLEVCFHRGAVTFGDAPIDLGRGTALLWLHDRIHKATLAGVAFLPGLAEDALMAFTARLLDLYPRNTGDDAFEALWPDAYPGLDLLDRRFTGTFSSGDPAAETSPRTWGIAGGAAIDLGREDDLIDRVAKDPAVQDALESLGARLATVTDEGEATREVDLLARIVRQMPGDVMADEGRIREITIAALGQLEERLEAMDDAGAAVVDDDGEVLRLMFEASQGLLGRTETPPSDPPEPEGDSEKPDDETGAKGEDARRARRRDAATPDDAALFLEEFAQLPPAHAEVLRAENLSSVGEQIGVCLHYLADGDETQLHPFAQRGLGSLLKKAGLASAAVLRQYLDPQAASGDDAGVDGDRLLTLLRAAGAAPRFRDLGLLAPAEIVEAFPREFGLYLDSLDPRDAAHRIELLGIAETIGEERILGAAGDLLGRERLLDPYRVERILSSPSRSMLPFARLLLEHGAPDQKRRVLPLLESVHGRGDVASLLSLVGEAQDLPSGYLRALTAVAPDAHAIADLRRRVTTELARIVRDEAGKGRGSARRLAAIQQLGTLATPEAELVLDRLVHAKMLHILPREPKAVRQAARLALYARRKWGGAPRVP